MNFKNLIFGALVICNGAFAATEPVQIFCDFTNLSSATKTQKSRAYSISEKGIVEGNPRFSLSDFDPKLSGYLELSPVIRNVDGDGHSAMKGAYYVFDLTIVTDVDKASKNYTSQSVWMPVPSSKVTSVVYKNIVVSGALEPSKNDQTFGYKTQQFSIECTQYGED